ncbi:hypothetical protein ABT269_37175 [Streptomyces viridosporus]|uniref:hypothetical protein n=1 Tax=Streptomyces viridosporus TaxID=67581 RepID=UPI003316E75D
MTATAKPLPAGWTIRLHRVHNLTVLTLHDEHGTDREIGFCPLTPDGPQDLTVSALDTIAHPRLREAAQNVVTSFYDRTAAARHHRDAFDRAVPDCRVLLGHLRARLPGCRADLGTDPNELTVTLTLTATTRAAGPLHALLARWPGHTGHGGSLADGIDQDLDSSGALTAALRQDRATEFLIWYRGQC